MRPIDNILHACARGRRSLRKLLPAALAVLAAPWAAATPVDWTFQDFKLARSSSVASVTASGGFTFDADTQTFSNVRIEFDDFLNGIPFGAPLILDMLYAYFPGDAVDLAGAIFRPLAGRGQLSLLLQPGALSNAGGDVVPVDFTLFGTPDNRLYNMLGDYVSGKLTGIPQVSTVPEPATWALAALGFAFVALRPLRSATRPRPAARIRTLRALVDNRRPIDCAPSGRCPGPRSVVHAREDR